MRPPSSIVRARILGRSKRLLDALRQIELASKFSNSSLAIFAGRGAGKESAARYAHESSARSSGPFVVANGASLTGNLAPSILFGHKKGAFTDAKTDRLGLFIKANGGTLFIDEIADLPLETQAMLLRAIEYGEIQIVGDDKTVNIDVRVIVATNRNLKEMVENGTFRADLYDRLTDFIVHLPPLRERGDDIVLLAQNFLDGLGMDKVLTKKAKKALLAYDWPGNVRQVRQVMLRCAAFATTKIITEKVLRKALCDESIATANDGRLQKDPGLPSNSANRVENIHDCLLRLGPSTREDVAKRFCISASTAKRDLALLVETDRVAWFRIGRRLVYFINPKEKPSDNTINNALPVHGKKILTLIKASGKITTREICNQLQISPATARRYLASLEESGSIERIRRGRTSYSILGTGTVKNERSNEIVFAENGTKSKTSRHQVQHAVDTIEFVERQNIRHQVGTKSAPSPNICNTALSQSEIQILEYAQRPSTIAELMQKMNWKDRTKFRKRWIRPLLEKGYLQMTIPDKPNSSKQKYLQTEAATRRICDG